MYKCLKCLLGISLIFSTGNFSEGFSSDAINAQELAMHCQNYRKKQLEECQENDKQTFTIRHNEAKKRKKTKDWPAVSREDYSILIEDTEKQIETVKSLLQERLEQIAPIYDIDVGDIDEEDNREYLTTQARIILEEEGFITHEKDFETQTNLLNYLTKNKPAPLIPNLTLPAFMKYLKEETDYKITQEKRKAVEDYLVEYFFIK